MGLGSNMGDREAHLARAIRLLMPLLKMPRVAPTYESEPLDGAGPGLFLNTVVSGWTSLEAAALLSRTAAIEAQLGRGADEREGPRTIDIDLLLLGECVQGDPAAIVPHPRMHARRFVLQPLLDLAPALADPRTGRPYRSFLAELPAQAVRLFDSRSP